MGRPSKYKPEIAQEICSRLMDGESLRKICRDEHMPVRMTVFRWLRENQEFCDQYAHARDEQKDFIFEQIVDLTDEIESAESNIDLQKIRTKFEIMRWGLGKLAPKKYGHPLGETVLDAEIKQLDAEKKRLEIKKLEMEIGDKDVGGIPDQEYTLTPDENIPENPVL